MLETNDLRLLDEVARSGSFTAAAELLGYTQSAVSRRIAAMERAAGGPLFERLARGVRLTPAGHALHRHALAILERLDQAREELAAIHTGGGGRLRIGAFATANVTLVPAALKRFTEVYPGVTVRLAEGLSPRLVERLEAGELDVAVISDYPAGLPGGRPAVPPANDRPPATPEAGPQPVPPEANRTGGSPEGDRTWGSPEADRAPGSPEGRRAPGLPQEVQAPVTRRSGRPLVTLGEDTQPGGSEVGRFQVQAGGDRIGPAQGGEQRLAALGGGRSQVQAGGDRIGPAQDAEQPVAAPGVDRPRVLPRGDRIGPAQGGEQRLAAPAGGRSQVQAGGDRIGPAQGGERRLVPLGEDRLLVALPSGHPLAGNAAVELADLREETWIEAAPRGQPTLLLAAAAAAGFVPRDGLRVAEWSGKFGFVAAGLGVTLVPELAARAVPQGVVLRPLTSTGPTRRYYAALPDVPLPAALAFVEHLRPRAAGP
ncbi:LysR family transcriptional regulator [Nonomuraea typhae]|uniref:LysR family transcriptional regulator n=1 Tax=Nonomuraea typhae TaxID=2603600 RepID=UPI001FE50D3F|nr:LysR substrate-binding domain-containing protein [Nonomuraea typhae]